MKKVGIITHYYLSSNYGGLLQAYALAKYLNSNGYDAKQITYNLYKNEENINFVDSTASNTKIHWFLKKVRNFRIKFINHIHRVDNIRSMRRDFCKEFREGIPHTEKIYDCFNIKECSENFDIYITGSDQVWNPYRYRPEFFLSFVNAEKALKVSYAASISNTLANDHVKQVFRDNLKDFTAISVREKSDVKTIQELTDKQVQWVLDPVFLLSKNEWIDQCVKLPGNFKKPYIFCYFLGDDVGERKLAERYGHSHNFQVVTIPYMQMNYRACDKNFGNIKLLDVSPNLFISLINNAEAVFTDSFHATAFSIIFGKQFVVFNRADHPEMKERINNVTGLFKCESRAVASSKGVLLEKIDSILQESTEYSQTEYEIILEESKSFLRL